MDPITRMYEWYGEQEAKRSSKIEKPSNRFRPSEIHGCARAIYYRMRGGSEKVPSRPGSFPIGRDGDDAHDQVRWDLYHAGVELDWLDFDKVHGTIKETKAFKFPLHFHGKDYLLSGRCDGKIKVDGEWMPLEIKSLNGFGYKYMLKAYNEGRVLSYIEEKYFKYMVQTMLCAHSLGFDKTYLIVKDRSSCQSGFEDTKHDVSEGTIIHNDQEIIDRYMGKMESIAKSLQTDTIPPHGYIEGSKECGWCSYKKVCGRYEDK